MTTVLVSATSILLQQQCAQGKNKPTLHISRALTPLQIASNTVPVTFALHPAPPLDTYHRIPIQGAIGIIWLLQSPHLLLITDSKPICHLPEPLHTGNKHSQCTTNAVHCVQDILVLPILPLHHQPMLTRALVREEQHHFALLRSILVPSSTNPERFYYSKGNYAITHTYQQQHRLPSNNNAHFWWNSHLIDDFKHDPRCMQWVLPLINGYVGTTGRCIVPLACEDDTVEMILIARRSRHHQGCRFTARGLDRQGQAANEVECEQLVMPTALRRGVRSFVQVRGSVPLQWSQPPTLLAVPRIVVKDLQQSKTLFHRHFTTLEKRYQGQVSCVNLVSGTSRAGALDSVNKHSTKIVHVHSNHGDQNFLGQHFEQHYHNRQREQHKTQKNTNHDGSFVWFDFHRECKGYQYRQLSTLSRVARPVLLQHSYYKSNGKTVVHAQHGIVRTNCMDTLDRTNVTQALFSGIMLLESLGIGSKQDTKVPVSLSSTHDTGKNGLCLLLGKHMNRQLRELWVECGDRMSYCYAHSPAQKKQVVRAGVYTLLDRLLDLNTSVVRYMHNNLAQGQRQDALDLFLGVYIPGNSTSLNLYRNDLRQKRWQMVLYCGPCLMVLVSFFVNLWVPTTDFSWFQWLSIVASVWWVLMGGLLYVVMKKGWLKEWTKGLVERPALVNRSHAYPPQVRGGRK